MSADAEDLAGSLPAASAAAMQAVCGNCDDPTANPSAPPADGPAEATPASPDIAAGQQSWHNALPTKRSRDSDIGSPVPAAARVLHDSLPSISEDLYAPGSPLAAAKPITGSRSVGKADFGRNLSGSDGNAALARLPSSWGSRASEASSATVVRAPSAEAAAETGAATASHRPALARGATRNGSAPDPLDCAAASAGVTARGATKPPVPRLSSLASGSGASGEVRSGGKLPGPLLSQYGSNATGSVASSVGAPSGSLAGSSNAGSGTGALPRAIDAVLATNAPPEVADEGAAGKRDSAADRSWVSADQLSEGAPVLVRDAAKDSQKPAAAAVGGSSGGDALGAVSEGGAGLQPSPPPAELRELPPSELEARVELAARLHGPQAPQVCSSSQRFCARMSSS